MERKARENLEAAQRLLADDPCTNAAVSHAYYASYQAAWVALVEKGVPVPHKPSGIYFSHKDLPEESLEHGALDEDGADELAWLEQKRVVADYYSDDVGLDDARECTRLAEALLIHLLGNDSHGVDDG